MGPTVSSTKTLDFYMMWASVLVQVSIIYLSCQVRLPKYRVSYCLQYWVKCNITWLLLVSSSFMMTQRKTSLTTVAKVSLILSNLGLKSSLKGHICQTQRSLLSTLYWAHRSTWCYYTMLPYSWYSLHQFGSTFFWYSSCSLFLRWLC